MNQGDLFQIWHYVRLHGRIFFYITLRAICVLLPSCFAETKGHLNILSTVTCSPCRKSLSIPNSKTTAKGEQRQVFKQICRTSKLGLRRLLCCKFSAVSTLRTLPVMWKVWSSRVLAAVAVVLNITKDAYTTACVRGNVGPLNGPNKSFLTYRANIVLQSWQEMVHFAYEKTAVNEYTFVDYKIKSEKRRPMAAVC